MAADPLTIDAAPGHRPGLAAQFRRASSFIPTGVAILSTPDVAMTVSSLHCVSFVPPMVTVALSRDSRKGSAILATGGFHVRLLRDGEEDISKSETIPAGAGMMEMDCTIASTLPAGDHILALANVGRVSTADGCPMIYWRRGFHRFRPEYKLLASREAFFEFVADWEAGILPKAQWTHAAHVAVGAYYAVRYPSDALERTRNGILRFNRAVGTENSDTSGYHETLTRMWSTVIAKALVGFTDPWEAACAAVHKFGQDRDLHYLYYSFDVVRSTEARRTWVPPDLEGPY